MLTYFLESNINGKKIYIYYPDGNMNPGRVAFYEDGSMEIIEDSIDDVKGYYRGHALHGIDTSKESGTVAWY